MAERPPGPGLSSSQQSGVGGEAGGPEASGDLAQGPEGDRTSELFQPARAEDRRVSLGWQGVHILGLPKASVSPTPHTSPLHTCTFLHKCCYIISMGIGWEDTFRVGEPSLKIPINGWSPEGSVPQETSG